MVGVEVIGREGREHVSTVGSPLLDLAPLLVVDGPSSSSSSSAIDSRAGQIFSLVDATKPAVR